jgi:hypothetical protein
LQHRHHSRPFQQPELHLGQGSQEAEQQTGQQTASAGPSTLAVRWKWAASRDRQ